MLDNINFLLVACSLEEKRHYVLTETINSLLTCGIPKEKLIVFDNNSIEPTRQLLIETFPNVYLYPKNSGYWSAINWWLKNQAKITGKADYSYIIESDNIHYNLEKLDNCVKLLNNNSDLGSVRTHEYSVKNYHLFDKGNPNRLKHKLCQSHINKITGQKIYLHIEDNVNEIYSSNFLTQLPALNRTQTLQNVFLELEKRNNFEEFDFQSLYWRHYQKTGIIDGGLFHCDLTPQNSDIPTGSWNFSNKSIGYQSTRFARIEEILTEELEKY